jgi:hypothetical protein
VLVWSIVLTHIVIIEEQGLSKISDGPTRNINIRPGKEGSPGKEKIGEYLNESFEFVTRGLLSQDLWTIGRIQRKNGWSAMRLHQNWVFEHNLSKCQELRRHIHQCTESSDFELFMKSSKPDSDVIEKLSDVPRGPTIDHYCPIDGWLPFFVSCASEWECVCTLPGAVCVGLLGRS